MGTSESQTIASSDTATDEQLDAIAAAANQGTMVRQVQGKDGTLKTAARKDGVQTLAKVASVNLSWLSSLSNYKCGKLSKAEEKELGFVFLLLNSAVP